MYKQYFNRLERLDYFIRIKATGTPKQLAYKLDICERSVYEYIETLRLLGADISYCKVRKSYYYNSTGYFCFRFINTEENGVV